MPCTLSKQCDFVGRTRLVEQKRKEIVERYKPEVEEPGRWKKKKVEGFGSHSHLICAMHRIMSAELKGAGSPS